MLSGHRGWRYRVSAQVEGWTKVNRISSEDISEWPCVSEYISVRSLTTIHIASMLSFLPNGLLDSAAKRITSRRTRCRYCTEISDCNGTTVATRVPTRTPLTCVQEVSSDYFLQNLEQKHGCEIWGLFVGNIEDSDVCDVRSSSRGHVYWHFRGPFYLYCQCTRTANIWTY
jgi:hypothetical protein